MVESTEAVAIVCSRYFSYHKYTSLLRAANLFEKIIWTLLCALPSLEVISRGDIQKSCSGAKEPRKKIELCDNPSLVQRGKVRGGPITIYLSMQPRLTMGSNRRSCHLSHCPALESPRCNLLIYLLSLWAL